MQNICYSTGLEDLVFRKVWNLKEFSSFCMSHIAILEWEILLTIEFVHPDVNSLSVH